MMTTASQDRHNIYPSTGALYIIKNRLTVVERGHGLLTKKTDALQHRSRRLLDQIIQLKAMLGKLLRDASISLAEVKYMGGAITNFVLENVGTGSASTKICPTKEHIVGIQVPLFVPVLGGHDCNNLTGLGSCGQRILKLRDEYRLALQISAQLASLQSAFVTINNAIKMTNCRVNGIGHVIIPRLKRTIQYIEAELDEQEREHLYRLKLVQRKQCRERISAEKRAEEKTQASAGSSDNDDDGQCREEPQDIFNSYKDDVDILF